MQDSETRLIIPNYFCPETGEDYIFPVMSLHALFLHFYEKKLMKSIWEKFFFFGIHYLLAPVMALVAASVEKDFVPNKSS